jgi:Fe-S cluster assembly ATP-binding protein
MLEIKNIHAETEGKPILKGLNLTIHAGECHAVMGPNGAGKSTLAKLLAGHPSYEITEGEILFKGQNINELSPEERAHLGLFMSFQYPVEISGLSNVHFLHAAHSANLKARGKVPMSLEAFESFFDEKTTEMNMRKDLISRSVNEGFSGGEKKKNEILQMALLEPDFAVLDETDSGLDIDALRAVSEGIQNFRKQGKALLLITHYQRLLDYVKPDRIHVLKDGKIVLSAGSELALELEKRGYDWLKEGSAC